MDSQHPPSPTVFSTSQASEVPAPALQSLRNHATEANHILPTLEYRIVREQQGHATVGHWWIMAYVPNGLGLILLLSLTTSYMNKDYPAFLFTPLDVHNSPDQYFAIVDAGIRAIISQMRQLQISPRRVYSVFGPSVVSTWFAHAWTEATTIIPEATPYYDAWLSFLVPSNPASMQALLASVPNPQNLSFTMGLATLQDFLGVALLCQWFGAESPPFTLTPEQAQNEARCLINRQQTWVLRVDGVVACMVAFTRNTTAVATITKVYTHPEHRGRRYANHLVRAVCLHLLRSPGRQTVALFVGINNLAANVYRRTGFVGIGTNPIPHPVQRWTEIGFDQSQVDLGRW